MEKMLDFNDIVLVPEVVSSIVSRDESIDTSFLIGKYRIDTPLIASPMKDVCDGAFGNELIPLGCFGVIHRFCSVEQQVVEFKKTYYYGLKIAAAVGINGDCTERFSALVEAGCNVFCIDVANGANIAVQQAIERFIDIDENVSFIVGNVASAKTFMWCSKLPNVIGVRVGIAGGNACTTKNATGIYCPMASLILECKKIKEEHNLNALIIADGGIREPQDFCKAIALGANCVMMGSVFAAALNSPAELIKQEGRFYKAYHGSASFEIQKIYKEKPRYIEGRTVLLDFNNETLEQVVQKFSDGLKSSMSYFNSRTISEFHKNATWRVK